MVVFFEGWKLWKRIPNNIVRSPAAVGGIMLGYIGVCLITNKLRIIYFGMVFIYILFLSSKIFI